MAGDGDLSVPGSDAKLAVSSNSKAVEPDDLAPISSWKTGLPWSS